MVQSKEWEQILNFVLKLSVMKPLYILSLILLSLPAFSQDPLKPRPSPLAIAATHYKDTYLKITYGQPQKNGREIFGGLVPFEQVWRTGANEATEITITRDIKVNGMDLKAGTYTLFTIPREKTWIIIFNTDLGQWGAYNYNAKSDILKFEIPLTPLSDVVYEPLTISINQKNDKAELMIAWDRTKVTLQLQFLEPKP
jgi:Protein of unknown function (DUF2911)